MNEFQSLQNNLKSKKELFKNEKWDRTQKFNEIINDALNLWPKISNFLNNRDSFDKWYDTIYKMTTISQINDLLKTNINEFSIPLKQWMQLQK